MNSVVQGYSIGKQNTDVNTAELFGVMDSEVSHEQITYKLSILNGDTLVILPRKDSGVSLTGLIDELLFLFK